MDLKDIAAVLVVNASVLIRKSGQDPQQNTEEVYQVDQRGKYFKVQGRKGPSFSVSWLSTEASLWFFTAEGSRKLWNDS